MAETFYHLADYKQTGLMHVEKGKECEDAVRVIYSPKAQAAVAALSDGAGSYKHAAEGARITVETAAEILSERFDELYQMPESEAVQIILEEIRTRLRLASEEQGGGEIIHYSATLLCAVLADDGRNMYLHVGDGLIAGCDMDGKCRVLSSYVHDIAPNYTTFVTIEDTDYHFHRGKGDISEFLLMSDGPEPYLKYGDELAGKGDLLAELSFFYSADFIAPEMKALTEELQKNGMTDDASFAVIADKRCAGNVFYKLSSNSMLNLFGLQKQQMTKDERRKIQKVFEDLATEDCVSEKQLGGAQYLHKYSEKIFDKLQNFLECGSLELLEGNYYRFP